MNNFDAALPYILKFEGGYIWDKDDPGGETNMGITQREYVAWLKRKNLPLKSCKNITLDEVKAIYQEDYWNAGMCDKMAWPVCLAHFDACVNCGAAQANKFIQTAVRVTADGMLGSLSIAAIISAPTQLTFCRMILYRAMFYRDLSVSKPQLGKFLSGWLKRIFELEKIGDNG